MEKATFAGGCFWCTEAIFQQIKGVTNVVSGYSGGDLLDPTYEAVSRSDTGHAETIQLTFDPQVVAYKDLLYIFFKMIDPTALDRQGADVGSQYRSMVFFHSEQQKAEAEAAVKQFQKDYPRPIVTEIVPFKNFYPAEGYHQDFYNKNRNATYCKLVIDPKIAKLKKNFGSYLKTS